MNKYYTFFFAAAFMFSASSSFAYVSSQALDQTVEMEVQTDNFSGVTYQLSVLAVHADGNRAHMSGTYKSLNQAHMAYQAFSFELPKGAEVIYAEIVDSRGNVIFSLN